MKEHIHSGINVLQRVVAEYIVRLRESYNFGGLVGGVIFYGISFLPSLMPRPWVFQLFITGLSVAIGYGIGTIASDAIRWATEYTVPQRTLRRLWRGLLVFAVIVIVSFTILGSVWQSEVSSLVGMQPVGSSRYLLVAAGSLILGAVFIGLGRGLKRLIKFIANKSEKYVPRRIAVLMGVFIVLVGMYWALTGVLFNFFVSTANDIYLSQNRQTPEGVLPPTSSLRSGGPGSLIAWDDIGFQGKNFIGGGPSVAQFAEFSGEPAKQPIRVYAGLESASTATERAMLALEELQRTGAFEREVLVLANVTGTGWLEPEAVDSIEYMHNGDTAIVAQQYSYLPSWISFLVDQNNATEAGQALFDVVQSAWAELPEASRPRLITYGLSLGSFAAQSPYAGANDLRQSVDGALFVGTPNQTRLWRAITDDRTLGSPQWLPEYRDGKTVQFAGKDIKGAIDSEVWSYPRVLYLQHASDPVVWFDFGVLVRQPDWLREPAGPDVSERMTWYPVVTFLQLAIDQFFGTIVPSGYGHMYGESMVEAWNLVAPPDDWSAEKAIKLQQLIEEY